jgi:hypothetical protein
MAGQGLIEMLFDYGYAADVILGVLAIEAAWLVSARRWSLLAVLGLLGPAALIVLGLRAAMTGADWWWIALPLAASLPLHLMDLRARLATRAER